MKSDSIPAFDGAYLERYRRGELSPSEAHALEKAALEDPLLADALDGFRMATQETSGDLNLLRVRLNERIESSQAAIRQMPKSQNFSPFLRVAAILLLLLGAGWFSYVYWVEPRESSLATNVPVNTPPADPRITTESVPAQPTQPSSPAQVQQITPVQQAPAPLDTPERQRTEAVDNVKADEGLIAQAAQPKVVYESKNTEPTPTEDLIKDQVVANADPIPQEADKANNRQDVVLAQEAKAKSLKRSGSIQQLAENPEPADGWKAYEDYLNNNRDSRAVAPTASNTVTHTQVLLSFDIDKKGRPSKVRVEESGGTFYDDAAKKLLLNGPDWKMGKSGARGQLRVHF